MPVCGPTAHAQPAKGAAATKACGSKASSHANLQARQELGRQRVLKALRDLRCSGCREGGSKGYGGGRSGCTNPHGASSGGKLPATGCHNIRCAAQPVASLQPSPAAHATRAAASASSRARRAAIRPCGRVRKGTPRGRQAAAAPPGAGYAAPRCPDHARRLAPRLSPWAWAQHRWFSAIEW